MRLLSGCGHSLGVCAFYRKIQELEEELKVVGNNMKSLEISEQEVKWVSYYSMVLHLSTLHPHL